MKKIEHYNISKKLQELSNQIELTEFTLSCKESLPLKCNSIYKFLHIVTKFGKIFKVLEKILSPTLSYQAPGM